MDPATGGFTKTRADTVSIARFQVHQINLEKGVSRLAFTLKNEQRSVWIKVSFPGSTTFEAQLTDAGEKSTLWHLSNGSALE
jgi:hypothetical protein